MSRSSGGDGALPHPLTGERFASPVPPGTGWPDDPARPDTPVAQTPADVGELAAGALDLAELDARVSMCRACPRLVEWRESVAAEKRRSFADQPYWGRPIAGWGDPAPRVLIIGLAPAANGGNRTGRVFTGDSSGDWLFASLYRVGLAAKPTSEHAGDGQRLMGARMVAPVRCAPPANKPTPDERHNCESWLDAELRFVVPSLQSVVCLGAFAWGAAMTAFARVGLAVPRPRPRFGHGVEVAIDGLRVIGCYHPSQHNTFTGRLTEKMLDAVFQSAQGHQDPTSSSS